jgi:SAM-dependent methyltransferase
MATYAFVHGAGDSGWSWRLVAGELRERGHDVVAVDLPSEDESAGLWDYAGAVVDAVGERSDLVVVAHSLGGFAAPLVCARVPVRLLVLVAAMVPVPGEAAGDWWANTGYPADADDDEIATYYHDVAPQLAAEAMRRSRGQAGAPMREPWPLAAWPEVPTRYLLCRDDRALPAEWLRAVVRERLGITPDEIDGGHCPYLSRPRELAERLEAYRAELDALDFYDVELRAHNERLRAATGVGVGERVLDVGCGTGQTTRDAAGAAAPGLVLGIDVNQRMVERARQLAAGLENVTFLRGDAQVHPFDPAHYDVAISRFGVMFFSDPVAAFTNIGRALRPGGRLVALVWQRSADNEWASAVDDALGGQPAAGLSPDPFSLGDPEVTARVLGDAGFDGIRFDEVRAPVFYGRDVAAALWWVHRFVSVRDAPAAERLRDVLAAHHSDDQGVLFDSRAWIVRATT